MTLMLLGLVSLPLPARTPDLSALDGAVSVRLAMHERAAKRSAETVAPSKFKEAA